jgi:general stress protein 26
MDSINANQSELNHLDLRSSDALAKIRELVDAAKTCFFCTSASGNGLPPARPMSVRTVDDEGNLWFLSAVDSHKNAQLANDATVTLYFQGSTHSDFMQLQGTVTVSTDKAIIKTLWEPLIRTWFTEGVDDPRITALRFAPSAGYYWDTKHGNAVAGVKMMIGAVLGKTMDDSIEGHLKV